MFFIFQKVTEECCVCKQPIKGDCIEVGKNKFYHPLCMRCFVCGDALRGQFLTFEEEPICKDCYKVRIDFCLLEIISCWLSYPIKHRAEKCDDCGEPIIGTCYTLNNKNYCEEHYREKCDSCPKCGEQIIGHMVRTSSAAFHPGKITFKIRDALDLIILLWISCFSRMFQMYCLHQGFVPWWIHFGWL